MIHVLAAQERNIKNAVERMHKSFSYGNTFIITKEDLPIFCLNDRKLSSPFYGTCRMMRVCLFERRIYEKKSIGDSRHRNISRTVCSMPCARTYT